MAEQQSWRGEWWVAAEPETVRPGVLHREEDDRFRLELVGGFDIQVREPLPGDAGWSVLAETRKIEMIHGAAEGKRFTLMYPNASHTRGGVFSDSIAKQDWSSNRVLKGIHLAGPDDAVFTRSHLQLDYLLHWSNRSTLTITIPIREGKRGDLEVHREDQLAVHAAYGELRLGLRVRSHEFNVKHRPAAGRTIVETEQWAVLDIDPPQPASYNAFDTINKDLQDLLTLCAYVPAASQGQSLIYESSEAHPEHAEFPNEVEVMGPQIYGAKRSTKDGQFHHNYLFTLDVLDFPELIPRWLAIKDKARMGCNILFGLRYIREGYVGNRLLGIATAAENIHRALRPAKTPLPADQFKALKRTLRVAVADQPDDVRAFVHNGLHNNPSYRERLLDLADIPDTAVVDDLLTDRQQWATRLKNSRNDLAHANERSAGGVDSSEAFWLLEITYALLHLVLMAELGLDENVQRKALEHPQISWARGQFQRILNGSMPE